MFAVYQFMLGGVVLMYYRGAFLMFGFKKKT